MTQTITSEAHKNLLYKLFYIETPAGLRPRQFPIDKLMVAAAASKKLLEGTKRDKDTIEFLDNPVEFTADEWVLLKELFKDKKTGEVREAQAVQELRAIFAPPADQ